MYSIFVVIVLFLDSDAKFHEPTSPANPQSKLQCIINNHNNIDISCSWNARTEYVRPFPWIRVYPWYVSNGKSCSYIQNTLVCI